MHKRNLLMMFLAFLLITCASLAGSAQNRKKSGFQPRTVSINPPGRINFLPVPKKGKALDVAIGFIKQNKTRLGLSDSDLLDLKVTDQYTSKRNGVTHIYLRQKIEGIEVLNTDSSVHITEDGRIINLNSSMMGRTDSAANRKDPALSATEAVEFVAKYLGLPLTEPLAVREYRGGAENEQVMNTGGVALEPIRAKLVYQPVATGKVRLAWSVELYEKSAEHWWRISVDAETASILAADDYVSHDTWATLLQTGTRTIAGAPKPRLSSAPQAVSSAYRVFELPKESPSDGPRTLVADPSDPTASPFGWHDTDGAPGAEFTVTRGNNVHAYTDIDANNVADPGSSPDGGPGLVFDFPLDLTMNPPTYRPATVTNLFYWNNIVHDVFYKYGFDEASGNFQVNNYGRGGVAGDDVRAEAQDGSGTNNANFATGVDGLRPRMQMFVWTHPLPNIVTVNAPSPIAGDYVASGAVFGPTISSVGPLTGDVTLVNDGAGPSTSDGCEALVGFPAGNIALLDRGTCTFVVKVKNAQNAGASAVIVANSAAGNPITMGGADPTITIASVMVSLDNGNLFKANLPFNATLSADPDLTVNRDSDLDSGVIAHEYGHGISNRLTGGPAVVNCLNNMEQMGEGWSDWLGLVLTTDPADTATTARGIGTYVNYEPPTGNGIRPTPYTTDLAVNPTTYGNIGGLAIPHGVGYAWATMLWEMYWNLVEAHGYNSNVYDDWTTGGNNLAIQLVLDGMKLQPCRPGFVDGRDAILQADMALTDGENQCLIWKAFAKRGLGVSANQGSNLSTTDGTEAFDMPPTCNFTGFFSPISNPPALNLAKAGSSVPVKFSLDGDKGLNILAAGYPASRQVDCDTHSPLGSLEPTATAGRSVLTYDPATDQYTYVWRTEKGWAGTCRELIVRFHDGTPHRAFFRFN